MDVHQQRRRMRWSLRLPAPSCQLLGHKRIRLAPEVEHALHHNLPVVAFESTIATHGLPIDQAVKVPLQLEALARSRGVIPCTFDAGLSRSELEELVDSRRAVKLSRRDLAPAIAQKLHGSTTVAATSYLAHLCGIRVFATGGIGGVHRNGQQTLDVSADLTELARTPTAVVCAGAKSILDIGRTLEYLETQSVTVATYGSSKAFPAFYSRTSGFNSPYQVQTPTEASNLMRVSEEMGLPSGILFAVPIPEVEEVRAASIQSAVEQAVRESEESGQAISGKDATPWLLSRVKELSGGESVVSNIALIKNNTKVACDIAQAYHAAKPSNAAHVAPSSAHHTISGHKLLVIGSSALDITAHAHEEADESTSPGTVRFSPGGVARNVAEAAHRLGAQTLLATAYGAEEAGKMLQDDFTKLALPVRNMDSQGSTAVCNMLLDPDGDLVGGVAQMEITESIAPREITRLIDQSPASVVAFDANLSVEAIRAICAASAEHNKILFYEPTSYEKCIRILEAAATKASPLSAVHHVCPNFMELDFMIRYYAREKPPMADVPLPKFWSSMLPKSHLMATDIFHHVWLTLGASGVVVLSRIQDPSAWPNTLASHVFEHGPGPAIVARHYPALPIHPNGIQSVTGAGDSFAGALLALLTRDPKMHETPEGMDFMVHQAQRAAVLALQSEKAVSPELTPALLS